MSKRYLVELTVSLDLTGISPEDFAEKAGGVLEEVLEKVVEHSTAGVAIVDGIEGSEEFEPVLRMMDVMESELKVSLRLLPDLFKAATEADWQQVVLNGGPPCFHLENGRFCLRAQRWAGHQAGQHHHFRTLAQLLGAP